MFFLIWSNYIHRIEFCFFVFFFSPIFAENFRPFLGWPPLDTSLIVHRGNAVTMPRPSLPSSMMGWNFTCKSEKFQVTFIAGTWRSHRYGWPRGWIPKFNPFHQNPRSTSWQGCLKNHPVFTVWCSFPCIGMILKFKVDCLVSPVLFSQSWILASCFSQIMWPLDPDWEMQENPC